MLLIINTCPFKTRKETSIKIKLKRPFKKKEKGLKQLY
jgi:hypothetical protein